MPGQIYVRRETVAVQRGTEGHFRLRGSRMNNSPISPAEPYFDVSGNRLRQGVSPHAVGVPAALRTSLGLPSRAGPRVTPLTDAETATACLELHSGSAIINIQVAVDLPSFTESSGYTIVGVSFSGDIYTGPEFSPWEVTSGYMGGTLLIEAEQGQVIIKPGETEPAVAESIIILGFFRNPITYPGIFGYNGYIFEYTHKTLFKGWQACS
jgi:hypothetical protein